MATVSEVLQDTLRPKAENRGWRAELQLGFTHRPARTVLSRRQHRGPLYVQRPFYPELDGRPHVYILHPPGGLAGGDELDLRVDVHEKAAALVTTPAAGKCYRSAGMGAVQRQTLTVADHGVLEWLPQENIIFEGADARLSTRVDLAENACFLGWEVTCLGRPASAEAFSFGHASTCFEIWQKGVPLFIERNAIEGGTPLLTANWGMGGYTVTGTFVAVNGASGLADAVRRDLPTADDHLFSVTQTTNVLIGRYLGHSGEQAREVFTRAWQRVRPAVLGVPAVVPRIWHT